jgi:vanillate O-demethylase ferredoxin subunit
MACCEAFASSDSKSSHEDVVADLLATRRMTERPPLTVNVAKKSDVASGIAAIELVSPTGELLPAFSAGAHIDVEATAGIVRQYSLCNAPWKRDRYLIAVLKERESRGGSAAMHALSEGQTLRISEPKNHFELDPSAKRSLLFAGGIGVTPILCMAQTLAKVGAEFDMHYCARTRNRMAFLDWIAGPELADHVHVHLDDGPKEQRLNLEQIFSSGSVNTHVYVCGPPPFIDVVLKSADAHGFPPGSLHREYFAVDPSAVFAPGGAFQVKLASSGKTFLIPPDRSVVSVLAEHGIEVPTSCEQGVCGTCVTRVLEGTPDHRDFYLNSEEHERNDQFMPCCSRSKTPTLVIDL